MFYKLRSSSTSLHLQQIYLAFAFRRRQRGLHRWPFQPSACSSFVGSFSHSTDASLVFHRCLRWPFWVTLVVSMLLPEQEVCATPASCRAPSRRSVRDLEFAGTFLGHPWCSHVDVHAHTGPEQDLTQPSEPLLRPSVLGPSRLGHLICDSRFSFSIQQHRPQQMQAILQASLDWMNELSLSAVVKLLHWSSLDHRPTFVAVGVPPSHFQDSQ